MNYTDAFEALQRETNVQLEDSLLTKLHRTLVEGGDYKTTEEFMEQAVSSELKIQ